MHKRTTAILLALSLGAAAAPAGAPPPRFGQGPEGMFGDGFGRKLRELEEERGRPKGEGLRMTVCPPTPVFLIAAVASGFGFLFLSYFAKGPLHGPLRLQIPPGDLGGGVFFLALTAVFLSLELLNSLYRCLLSPGPPDDRPA